MEAATIGSDISKHVFHIHAVDSLGQVAGRQRLRRGEIVSFFSSLAPCLVGIEACTTAHYWAREIRQFGHDVRLIPPAYVKPYLRRDKNDAADAAAICEAVSRPNMRFVPGLLDASSCKRLAGPPTHHDSLRHSGSLC
ncbi:transposase [Bradyrhizobium sp. GM24.11]